MEYDLTMPFRNTLHTIPGKKMTGSYNLSEIIRSFGYLDFNEKTFGNLFKRLQVYATWFCSCVNWQLNGVNSKFENA